MSKPVVYLMKRPGWLDWFELHVCSSDAALRAYARPIFKKHNWPDPPSGWNRVCGLNKPEDWPRPDHPFAYLFLSEESLRPGLIAHEALHVSMAHERFVSRFGMAYGDGFNSLDDEERLAYFLGACVDGIHETLSEHGHFDAWKRRTKK